MLKRHTDMQRYQIAPEHRRKVVNSYNNVYPASDAPRIEKEECGWLPGSSKIC